MEYTCHITFDCPSENLRPETVAEMAANYIERGLGVWVFSVSVDQDRNPDAPNEAWMDSDDELRYWADRELAERDDTDAETFLGAI